MQWCKLTLERDVEVIRDVDDRGRVKANGKDYKSGEGWIAPRRTVRVVVKSVGTGAVKFDRELEPAQRTVPHTIPSGQLEVYLVGAIPQSKSTHPLPTRQPSYWRW